MYDAQDFILRQESIEEETRTCSCCDHQFEYDTIKQENDYLCEGCFGEDDEQDGKFKKD